MQTHAFTLSLGQPDYSHELESQLLKAGCDDAGLYSTGDQLFLEFEREAGSFPEALESALLDVEKKAGVMVLRVHDDDLVNASQIADHMEVSREYVRQLKSGERGPGLFPPPVQLVKGRSLWNWGDVARWLHKNGLRDIPGLEDTAFIESVNAALTLRRSSAALAQIDQRRIARLFGYSARR